MGRPLIAELLAKGHALVALTRSPVKAQALVEQGYAIEQPPEVEIDEVVVRPTAQDF